MEKKNFKNLWKTKIITNLVSSLYIIPVKILPLFLTWRSNYQVVSLPLIYISSLQIDTNIYILRHPTETKPKDPLHIVKHLE